MAPHSPEWKGRRRSIQIATVFIVGAIVSLPAGFVFGALMTPLLWKLERILGLELAGHSGPSDWILLALSAAFATGVTVLYAWATRGKRAPPSNQAR